MSQPTLAQMRASDPILTSVARGYSSPKASIADALFPIVSVMSRAGRIMEFSADGFRLVGTSRAPGANTKRMQFGFGTKNFSLVDHRLEGTVPRELQQEAMNGPGIDLAANAVRRVQDVMALEREKQAADLACDLSNYESTNKKTLSGSSQWSHVDSTPFADIMTAKEAIRSQTGEEPNVLALSPKALTALRTHAQILGRLSTAADRPPASLAQLAALLEVEQIVKGGALYYNGSTLTDVWGTHALLAYTTPASMQEMGSPSYGYTYQLGDGVDVEPGYYDNNTATWNYPVSDAYQPVLAGKAAGYFFKDAAA